MNDAMLAADEAEMHAIGDHEQRQVDQLGNPLCLTPVLTLARMNMHSAAMCSLLLLEQIIPFPELSS